MYELKNGVNGFFGTGENFRDYLLLFSHFSGVQLFCSPMDYSHQAPLSVEFYGQDYWSGLPFPSPGNLPDSGIERGSLSPLHCMQILYSWATGEPRDYLVYKITNE